MDDQLTKELSAGQRIAVAAKHYTKKVGSSGTRMLFPYVWHYFTDHYEGRFHHLIVDAIISMILLALVAMNLATGLLLYVYAIPPDLEVTVSIDEPVISGAPLTAHIGYNNHTKAVADVAIQIDGPEGWQVPTDEAMITFNRIGRGDSSVVNLTHEYVGVVDYDQRIIVQYSYKYFGQEFYGLTFVEFTPNSSSFELVPTGPEKILNTEEAEFTFEYTNSADTVRKNSCITIDVPDAFVLSGSEPEITPNDKGDLVQCFEELAARANGVIKIRGTFKNSIGEGQQAIHSSVTDLLNGKTYEQVSLDTNIQVLTPRLQLALTGPSVEHVGDTVTYTHSYKNTGDATLRDVRIVSRINNNEGELINVSAVNGTLNGGTAIWVDPEIKPGETHTRTLVMQINSDWRVKNEEYDISTQATAQIDDLGIETYVPPASIETKLISTLEFAVVQKYYGPNGEQLGYGPLPMEADEITATRVFWEVRDFTNDLTNITIQATLPSQVEWTNIASVTEGSAIRYDEATRTVIWHTGKITSFAQPQGAQFEIRILPNWQQVGQLINLTNETKFTALDSNTGTVLSQQVGPLKTDQPIK